MSDRKDSLLVRKPDPSCDACAGLGSGVLSKPCPDCWPSPESGLPEYSLCSKHRIPDPSCHLCRTEAPQSPLPVYAVCGHGADERTCTACMIHGPTIQLPSDWRREGMVVVADSMTGKLLGCMGRETWKGMPRD